MCRVRREDMRNHVVIRLAVISHHAEELYFDGPVPGWSVAAAKIAFLATLAGIRHVESERGASTIGCYSPHDKLNGLSLCVRPDSGLVWRTIPRIACDRRSCIDLLHGNCECRYECMEIKGHLEGYTK